MRSLVVSKDVRRHRLISINYIKPVTAEVASSSLVVPAIPNQALTPVEEFSNGHKKVQIPREGSNFRAELPYNDVYVQPRPTRLIAPLLAEDASIRHFQQSARLPRCGLYAWRLSPPGCKFQGHADRRVSQQFLHYFQIRSDGPKQCGIRVPEGMPSDALGDPQLLGNRAMSRRISCCPQYGFFPPLLGLANTQCCASL